MDSDFMQRRARALFLCLMGGEKAITSNAMINAIVTAFEDVRTAALEEAAKVALARAEYWSKQPVFSDKDDALNSISEVEARAVAIAIRALKPVTP